MSLLNLSRQYILDVIKSYQSQGSLTSLIIDDSIKSSLYRVVPKDTLLRYVTLIELIESPRKIQPFIEAIYLLPPTLLNIKCILADIQVKRYKKGHALFLEPSQLPEYQKIVQHQGVYFQSITILPFSMYPAESNVFLTDLCTPNPLPLYYNENCSDLVLEQIGHVARTLVSMMAITGEYPLIRYFSPPASKDGFVNKAARLPELIANEFQIQIDNYARLNQNYPPPHDASKPRLILLITDRTMDLYAPLLHEFLYQAMANDIVPSLEREGKYTYKSENEKGEVAEVNVYLDNESDQDWISLRHLHIIESSELIIAKINELIAKNPLMVDRTKATTSTDLMYIVAHLKGFDDERKQVTLHKTLIDECLDRNSDRKLAEFAADFEQTCAAGGTSFEGIRNKQLAGDLIELLAREDLAINDKMRLVLIYALYRGGLISLDFKKLVKFIGLTDVHAESVTQRCFTNFQKLGFQIIKPDIKLKKSEKVEFHTINNEGTFNTSRYGPGIKSVLQKASKYQLDEETFPYFRDKPLEEDLPHDQQQQQQGNHNGPLSGSGSGSLRNPRIKASWAQSSNKVSTLDGIRNTNGGSSRPKQRIFCYVAGGMTYSEMRSVYELTLESQNNKEFFVGSEGILKPRDFLIGLQSIDSVKTRAELDLNLDKQRQKSHMKAPAYLLETPQQKPVTPQPYSSSHNVPSASLQQSSFSSKPLSGNGRPISSSSNGSSKIGGLPLHYQTRISQGGLDSTPGSPEGEKKKKPSKLKRLFK